MFKSLVSNALPNPLLRSLKQRFRARRVHVYCVGAGKTGTHSMAEIFAKHFRAAHEPERSEMRRILRQEELGKISREDKRKFLWDRDTRLFLEVEAAAFNRRNIGLLAELFPQAKFIVTVRDAYTYTDSVINHLLNHSVALEGERRGLVGQVMGDGRFRHAPEERELLELELHTLDGYLSNYAASTADILQSTPADRCLVIRTDKIRESVADIANFVGVRADLLDTSRSHAFKATKRFGVLARMDSDFVDAKVREHCADLMSEYFPEIRSVRDVMTRLRAD